MDYLDFELRVGPGAGADYPVDVVHSPAGETSGIMHFPFDLLALQNHLQAVEIAVLRSSGTRRDLGAAADEVPVSDFGRQLFQALMSGPVHESFRRSQDRARAAGKGLRIRLRIEAPELAALPWEYLYDPAAGDYVCLSSDTPVVRYLEFDQPVESLLVRPPLSVLGVVAAPNDRPTLDAARERERIEAATTGLRAAGALTLTWLEGSTWRDLQRAMRRGPYHVLHFVGHGGFDAAAGEGVIALTDDDGRTAALSATQLGRLLADHDALRLAVLNACLGARGSGTDVFSSTAATLVRRGVPAVIAMQYEISDRAAVEFGRSLYEALADGVPVDAAVSEARKAISFAAGRTVEWGTPVLHMRSPDGVLFRIDGPSVTATRRAQAAVTPPPPPLPPPGPSVAEQVSALRARLLLAAGEPELRALRYEVEALGEAHPADVGVRMLRDQVVGALRPPTVAAPPPPAAAPRRSSAARWSVAGLAASALLAVVVVQRSGGTAAVASRAPVPPTPDTVPVVGASGGAGAAPSPTASSGTGGGGSGSATAGRSPASVGPAPTPVLMSKRREVPPHPASRPAAPPVAAPVAAPVAVPNGTPAGAPGGPERSFAAVVTGEGAPFTRGDARVRSLSLEPDGARGWTLRLGVALAPAAGAYDARVACTFRGAAGKEATVPVRVTVDRGGTGGEFLSRFRAPWLREPGAYPVECTSQRGGVVFAGRVAVR